MCPNLTVTLLRRSLPDPKTNILIDSSGCARLAGFTLLTMAPDQLTITSPATEDGIIRWMSPELLNPDKFGLKESRPTKESDCYALGMVIYEVLSGQTPFAPCTGFAIIWKVLQGQRPGRPQGEEGKLFTNAIWGALELSWKPQPGDRISAKDILLGLERNPRPFGSSNANGGTVTDASS